MMTFCSFFVVIYAFVTPNIGSLYRMRYGFLMTLAAIALAASLHLVRGGRNYRRN
jgi:hypothetical protein